MLFFLQVVRPQKNGKKVTIAPGNKVGETKSLAPMFAEKLISPHRKGATWAKLPKDRSAKLGDHEKRNENCEEDEGKTHELGPAEEGKKSWGGSWLVAETYQGSALNDS